MTSRADVEARLAESRAETQQRIDSLTREYDGIVSAADDSVTDDEHDPEGATIAFEREQLAALIAQARRQLAELDAAEQRLASGDYGTCVECGRPISEKRLAARPATRTCIGCAG